MSFTSQTSNNGITGAPQSDASQVMVIDDFPLDFFERKSTLYRWIIVLERTVSCALLGSVFAIVILQVVTRYVFHSPLSWTEETARLLMVWLTFTAAAYVASRKEHLSVDLTAQILPPALNRFVGYFAQLVTVATALLMAVAGFWMTILVSPVSLPASSLPTSILYFASCLGFAGIFVHGVLHVVEIFIGQRQGPTPQDFPSKVIEDSEPQ